MFRPFFFFHEKVRTLGARAGERDRENANEKRQLSDKAHRSHRGAVHTSGSQLLEPLFDPRGVGKKAVVVAQLDQAAVRDGRQAADGVPGARRELPPSCAGHTRSGCASSSCVVEVS